MSSISRKLSLISLCAAVGLQVAGAAETESERLAKLEKAVSALQEQNSALKREVSELKGGSGAHSSSVFHKSLMDGKSYVETAETEKKPVYVVPAGSETKLALGGFAQIQYEVGDIAAFEGRFAAGNKDRFRLRRARINVSGDFAEQFDFKLEGDFEQNDTTLTVRDASGKTLASSSTRTAFGATDIFVNWHAFPEFNIKVGQFKAPFGLEQLTPDTKLFVNERSQVTSALTPERQLGVQLWGKPLTNVAPAQKDLLTYSVGVFNGNGRNFSVNDNNEYMFAGRIDVLALKTKFFNEETSLKLGANGLTSRDEAGTNLTPVGNVLVNGDGSLSAFTAPSAAQRDAYGFDASLHVGPFDLVAEYLSERFQPRTVAGIAPRFREFNADGYYVQGSYFLVPKKLQFVTKYESFNPGQVANDDVESITAGVNYYIKGDDIKLLADYIHTWSDFREHNPKFGRDNFNEVIVRLQLMF